MLKKPVALACRLMLVSAVVLAGVAVYAVGNVYPLIVYFGLGTAAVKATHHRVVRLWSAGTGRLAGYFDLLRNGMLCGDSGLIFGRVGDCEKPTFGQAFRMLLDPRFGSDVACQAVMSVISNGWGVANRMIRITTFCHLLTVAPPGKGKSTSVLGPNLMSYRGSVAVFDPKAELVFLTADHRRDKLRQRVFVLDPAGLCDEPGSRRRVASDGFNPMDFVSAEKPDFLAKCRDLANMIVVRKGTETEPHWNDSAELVLTAFIAFVVACEPNPELRTLCTVRRLISSPTAYARSVKTMQSVKGFWGIIAGHGKLLQWFMDRELGSIMTTAQRHSAWMDDPHIIENLSHTTFDPKLLRTGKVSVYFVVPGDRITIWQGLLRLWLGCSIRIATEGRPTEKNPVLFLVDEAGHIGNMRALQDGITLLRGMGIRIWLFVQSIQQLHEAYGNYAEIMLGSIDTQQYFGTNSFATAQAISQRIGAQTLAVRSENGGGGTSSSTSGSAAEGRSFNSSRNWGHSIAEQGRPVLTESEILVMPEDTALIFHRNVPCIAAKLLRYFDAKEFRNGGTGVQRGVGLGIVLASAAVLLVSLTLTIGVAGWAADQARMGGMAPGYERHSESRRYGYWDDLPLPPGPEPSPSPYRVTGRRRTTRPAYRSNQYQMPAEWDGFSFWDPSTWGY